MMQLLPRGVTAASRLLIQAPRTLTAASAPVIKARVFIFFVLLAFANGVTEGEKSSLFVYRQTDTNQLSNYGTQKIAIDIY